MCALFDTLHVLRMSKKATKIGRFLKQQLHLAMLMLVVIAAFVVSWTPYAVCATYSLFVDPSFAKTRPVTCSLILAKAFVVWNMFIYGFKVSFWQIFTVRYLRPKQTGG